MVSYRELKESKELFCLRRLANNAPDMKLKEARDLASEHGRMFADMMVFSAALAILAETILGFDKNGKIPPDDNRRSAVAWAMKQAQNCHGGWVCGPGPDNPMETLMQEKDAEWLRKGTSM